MDGWRKPKRNAVDPPGASSAPEPDAREPSDRRGVDSPATRADALPADALPPAFANGDLAPVLFRLREDLESTKRFFAAQKNASSSSFAPGERERLLLSTQDALLSATERLTSARAERDAARAETAHAEDARRRADEAFARAADAEADALTELRETRRELARLTKKEKHERARGSNRGAPNANANDDDGGPETTTTHPTHPTHLDTPHHSVVAALTLRAETAERRADATRVALEETRASSTERDAELRLLRERVAGLEGALQRHEADRHETESALVACEAKTLELSNALQSAKNDAEDAESRRSFLEKTFSSHRDAARAETDALRVAVDAAHVAAAEAERSRVCLTEETRKVQTELTSLKTELERVRKDARDAADAAERAKAETRRLRIVATERERRLARVVGAMRVVDDAAAHVRAVARGDEQPQGDDGDDGDEREEGDARETTAEKKARRRELHDKEKAFPASLAESLGPTRRPSPRRDTSDAAAALGASTFPGASPLADSVPASAEAAPVTAPVPQRRGKRQRMTRQK